MENDPNTRAAQPGPGEPSQSDRAQGGAYPHEVEDRGTPPREDGLPRPAGEPAGSEHSSDTNKTLTDPSTGEPHLDR